MFVQQQEADDKIENVSNFRIDSIFLSLITPVLSKANVRI